MVIYGIDLSCGTDLDALLRDVTGNELMSEVCLRRLYCRKGLLLSDPNDNTLDARDFIGSSIGPGDLIRIQALCASALLGDERIQAADVSASFDRSTSTLTLVINATGANGPFSLTLAVTVLSVELLRPS